MKEFYNEANTGTSWDGVNKRMIVCDWENGGVMYIQDKTKPQKHSNGSYVLIGDTAK